MGTLRKVKTKMKLDKDLRHLLVRGGRNEILLDLDGDKLADLALLDEDGDGDIDTIAMDLTGDGEFNLYFVDSDHNHVPDAVLFDRYGDGDMVLLDMGEDVENAMIAAAQQLYYQVMAEEYLAEQLDGALESLEKEVRQARKELKKR